MFHGIYPANQLGCHWANLIGLRYLGFGCLRRITDSKWGVHWQWGYPMRKYFPILQRWDGWLCGLDPPFIKHGQGKSPKNGSLNLRDPTINGRWSIGRLGCRTLSPVRIRWSLHLCARFFFCGSNQWHLAALGNAAVAELRHVCSFFSWTHLWGGFHQNHGVFNHQEEKRRWESKYGSTVSAYPTKSLVVILVANLGLDPLDRLRPLGPLRVKHVLEGHEVLMIRWQRTFNVGYHQD